MDNNRNHRADRALETLRIIEDGYYLADNQKIEIGLEIKDSVQRTILYTPESFSQINPDVNQEIEMRKFQTSVIVENCTAMEAAEMLSAQDGKIGCLNFASAKNPGGGFLEGAQAQEESLARASSLYPTLMKYFSEMYEYNRSRNTYLYSDYMIYSPDVVFFRDDADRFLAQPYKLDILTSPAVNVGAMKQNRPEELLLAEEAMLSRIDKLLSVFVHQKISKLILGAWGCGVFRNDPKDIARYFAHYLTGSGKYAGSFHTVMFAVFDRSKNQENIAAFKSVFGKD